MQLQLIVEVGISLLTRSAARVHLRCDGVSDIGKLLLLLLEVLGTGLGTVLLEPLGSLLDSVEDGLLLLVVNLATKTLLVVDLVLEAESVVLETVTSLDALTGGLVLLGVLLSLGDHAVNLLLGETALVVGNGDRLLLASTLVVGGDLEDTVGIELEGDLDLRNTTRSGGDTSELKLAKDVVILGHGTLTLEDLDQDNGLVISSSREDLALAGRDRSVAGNELGHDTTSGLNSESQGVDIHENNLLSALLARQNTGLNGGTESNGLVGVDALGSLLAVEVLLNEGLDLGDTGGATDKDDVVNLGLLNVGILENLFNGLDGLLEEIHVQLLELGAGKGLREVVALEESLNLDTGAHLRRESTLGLFSLTLELAHSLGILGDVDVVLLVVRLGEVVDDTLVEILSTKMGVTSSSKNLEDTVVNGQERDIKGTTTEIVDNDLALTVCLIQTVGDSGGGGLVDNSENVETGNDTSILGGLALVVLWKGLAIGQIGAGCESKTYVEVGGDGDDGVSDLLAEVRLSNLLHLAKNHGRNFLRSELLLLASDLDLDVRLAILSNNLEGEVLDISLDVLLVEVATNKAPIAWLDIVQPIECAVKELSLLHVEDGVEGVGRGLVLGGVTNETLLLGEGDVGRSDTVTLIVD